MELACAIGIRKVESERERKKADVKRLICGLISVGELGGGEAQLNIGLWWWWCCLIDSL